MVKLLRLIVAASVAELALGGALASVLSLFGGWNGWCDLLAAFTPLWLTVSALGAVLARVAFPPSPERRIVLGAGLAGVLACVGLMAPELNREAGVGPAPPKSAPLKLLTFNVWDDNRRPFDTVDAITESGADIVALQEVNGLSLAAQVKLTAAYPYRAPCPLGCDLALLSKRPWSPALGDGAAQTEGYYAVSAVTTAPDGRPVEVVTTHYMWPLPPTDPPARRARMAKFIATQPRSDLILAGDFNLAPWTAGLRRQDAALAPLVRRTRAVFTWPANIARLDAPAPVALLPIDQVYAGPAWRTLAVERLRRAGSDHYGVLVTLARP